MDGAGRRRARRADPDHRLVASTRASSRRRRRERARGVEAARAARPARRAPASTRSSSSTTCAHALYAAKVCSLRAGHEPAARRVGDATSWDLKLGELARIWKGGCIIRAQFLGRIKEAYERNADLPNLLLDGDFARELAERQAGWRRAVTLGIAHGVPLPTMTASLSYYDAYRRERLPANLTQAQRDFFGAHTYQRIDREGTFHTEWT